MVKRPVLVAVGDLLVDVAVRGGPGHDAHVSVCAGGSAANVAVWAAHLGARTSVIGRVGSDLAGRTLRTALEERGVEARLTFDAETPTGTFVLLNGERFVDRGANASLTADDLPATIQADVIAVSPYIEPAPALAVVQRARAPWIVALGRSLRGANGLVLNESEAEEGVHILAEYYRLACVTLGGLGAIAVLDGEERSASAPAVDSPDTTGAGDAFAAALLVSLTRGAALSEALEEACRIGAEAAASPSGWPVVE